jgi:hypothetical protein
MSNDISYQYTKTRNKECGRNGYYAAHREKCTVISPSEYGMFLQRKRNRGNTNGK